MEKQLLSEHLTGILHKGLENLLEENRLVDLSLLYSLFSRVKNGLNELCMNFNTFIKVSFISFSPKFDRNILYTLNCVISKIDLIFLIKIEKGPYDCYRSGKGQEYGSRFVGLQRQIG